MTFLDDKLFKLIVSNTPLFSIDIVLLNEKNEILTGLKKILQPRIFGSFQVAE